MMVWRRRRWEYYHRGAGDLTLKLAMTGDNAGSEGSS
jgi:hypothetical protein